MIASVVVILSLAAPLRAQDAAAPALPTVVTTGTALVQRSPDVAFVTLGVETRARTTRDAERINAETMSAVQKRLADLGVPKDGLKTRGLWLEQEFEMSGGRRVPRGFVARNSVEVRVDDVGRAGEIADAAVEAGATSIAGIRFDLKDRTAAELEALRLAVVDARRRADAAAAGAGRTVDRVLRIEDQRVSSGGPRPMIAYARAEAAQATTPVEPGLLDVEARVTLTAALK